MEKSHVVALRRAIKVAGGNPSAFAARLREAGRTTASQQLVSYWLKNAVLLDPDWWPLIEKVTDSAVTRRDLRPDVFSMDHVA